MLVFLVCSSLGHSSIITMSWVADCIFINAHLLIYLRCESGTLWAPAGPLLINLPKTLCLLQRPGGMVYMVLEEEGEGRPRLLAGVVSWLLLWPSCRCSAWLLLSGGEKPILGLVFISDLKSELHKQRP